MLATYYQSIYLVIVVILSIIVMSQYSRGILERAERKRTANVLLTFCIVIFMILFIGLRPIHDVFSDTVVYASGYSHLWGETFYFEWETQNLIYDNLLSFMACSRIPLEIFFLIIAAVYFCGIFIACKKLFPKDVLLAFVVYLSAFSTFSYATNGIKAGAAASLFLVALAYIDKKWLSVIFAILTYGMHHSMALVIVAYFIVLYVKNPKFYFFVWGFSFVIAALHITWFQHLFAGFTDEHGAGYLLSEQNTGFRIDFIIYSSVPVIIGYWLIFKRALKSKIYSLILNLYLLTNSVWMLCMYSSFTNRISYLSWFLYPIVLLYPFVNLSLSNRQYVYLKYAVWGHLGFTLFMHYIYYGILK